MKECIEGAPHLKDEHLAVFDCAFRAQNGTRSIHWMGHVRMMGAVQPFLSGAISKTVNLPADASVEDVMDAYVEGWKLGLKALAIYRDGSKRTQPLNAGRKDDAREAHQCAVVEADAASRASHEAAGRAHGDDPQVLDRGPRGLPHRRHVRRRHAGRDLPAHGEGGLDGLGPDGHDRDDDVHLAAVRRAAPQALVDKFSHTRFEPAGFTNNRDIPIAKSITDYVFRYLGNRYLSGELEAEVIEEHGDASSPRDAGLAIARAVAVGAVAGWRRRACDESLGDSVDSARPSSIRRTHPAAMDCGTIMVRNGACYKCPNCGSTSGCS